LRAAGESPCTVTAKTRILGTAYSDHDLVVFLEGAGVADPEPSWTTRGGWSDAAVPPTSSAAA
jgi:hypothetical protein